jgi:hypothetical protein
VPWRSGVVCEDGDGEWGQISNLEMLMETKSFEMFFRHYAELTVTGDVEGLVACFAERFLAGGPGGAQPVRASDFAQMLPKRYALFKSLGCRRTELVDLKESRLDERHVSAWTRWRLTFERPDVLEVEVDSTYLVETESMRILVYLAHQDVMERLKEHGIG